MADPDRLEIRSVPKKGRWGSVGVLAAALGLLAGAVLLREESAAMRVMLMVLALYCGGLVWVARHRMLGSEPMMVADTEGIHLERVGFVPWSDVSSVEARYSAHGRMVHINVHDRAKYIEGQRNTWLRILMRIAAWTRSPFVAIPTMTLDDDPDTLKARLERLAGRSA